MSMDRLWAGWRSAYIDDLSRDPAINGPDQEGLSLFERILHSDLADETTTILWRGETCFALLNAYPYGTAHTLVLPKRAVGDLAHLSEAEAGELWLGARLATRAIRTAYEPDGINIGLNLGSAAGAGVPDHLHVHVLPRWAADANFMTAVAEARVLPEALSETWRRLVEAWPTDPTG